MQNRMIQEAHRADSRVIYLSDKQLGERYGVHRTAIWRWVREGGFPAPIQLSKGCTRWLLSEVEKWEAEKAAR